MHLICYELLLVICLGIKANDERIYINHEVPRIREPSIIEHYNSNSGIHEFVNQNYDAAYIRGTLKQVKENADVLKLIKQQQENADVFKLIKQQQENADVFKLIKQQQENADFIKRFNQKYDNADILAFGSHNDDTVHMSELVHRLRDAKPVPIEFVSRKPVTRKPVTPKPDILKPGTLEAVTLEPGTLKPDTLTPGTIEPSTHKPVTFEPFTLEPDTLKPVIHETSTNRASESSDGVGHSGGTKNSSCNTVGCQRGLFLSSVAVVVVVVICLACFLKHYGLAGKARKSPSNVLPAQNVTNPVCRQNRSGTNIFKSGFWETRYFQDDTWHGPHQLSLWFDPNHTTLTGLGMDDVGKFTFAGTYSNETRQIDVKKEYSEYLDNRSENSDYPTTIQLMWNSKTDQFEGKWSVQTDEYNGEDLFDLKFQKSHLPVIHAEV
ncbi:unnamed protein product [Adineta steineri]|uniref:Uncharacterized protein n=1 Tax=Adineta steineri TaxID=433720 RepID=A0A814JM43_9BILA|nr:unnamed protein product [Adineta steineri]CAF1102854.1 unnamed protein product [Adineta steineri]